MFLPVQGWRLDDRDEKRGGGGGGGGGGIGRGGRKSPNLEGTPTGARGRGRRGDLMTTTRSARGSRVRTSPRSPEGCLGPLRSGGAVTVRGRRARHRGHREDGTAGRYRPARNKDADRRLSIRPLPTTGRWWEPESKGKKRGTRPWPKRAWSSPRRHAQRGRRDVEDGADESEGRTLRASRRKVEEEALFAVFERDGDRKANGTQRDAGWSE